MGCTKLVRYLTVGKKDKNKKDLPVTEFDLAEVLKGFDMDMNSFVDLCILCGCD